MSNINPWTLLVLGILVGWLIGWLLELWYFRRQRLHCQREVNRLEGQLRARNAELGAASSQISALRGELGTRAKEIDALLYQLAKNEEQADADPSYPEPIPVWKGAAEPNSAMDAPIEVVADTEDDIELPEKTDLTQTSLDTSEISPDQWAILRAAGITPEDDLASISPDDLERIFSAPEWQQVEDETIDLQVSPSAITQADIPDDMTLIAGIGPKYAALLQEHGITTFAQLSVSDPATLSTMFATSVGRPPDVQSWIDQAQTFQAEG